MTMSHIRTAVVMAVAVLLAAWINLARAENGVPISVIAGSWIVDAGPGQFKTVASYAPIDGDKFTTVHSSVNFDWSLNGQQPTATHGSTLHGIVEKNKEAIDFILIMYALDDTEKAVYIVKAIGNKVLKDQDTMSVENMVLHIYTEPETDNPVTDTADFTIPETGTFPPIPEYRIKLNE
jgi:hypothetical protein